MQIWVSAKHDFKTICSYRNWLYQSREVDRLCDQTRKEAILAKEPMDSGYPIGYWAGYKLKVSS